MKIKEFLMKQFLVPLFLTMYIFTVSQYIHATLQHELNVLSSSLQALEQRLQPVGTERPLPPPPPPPAPLAPTEQPVLGLFKSKHYEYKTPAGKVIDIVLGLKNISKDKNYPAYNLVLYGPQLRNKPTEEIFNNIIKSIKTVETYDEKGQRILKNSITYYPEFLDVSTKVLYTVIDGSKNIAETALENKITAKLQTLQKENDALAKIFTDRYGHDRRSKLSSIYTTPLKKDTEYVERLANFLNQILKDKDDYYNIQNLAFIDEVLMPQLKNFFNRIDDFYKQLHGDDNPKKFIIGYFKSLSPNEKGTNLTPEEQRKKFGNKFADANEKKAKASEYKLKVKDPIDAIFSNFNNVLQTVQDERQKYANRIISEAEKYYNNFLIPQEQRPTTLEKTVTTKERRKSTPPSLTEEQRKKKEQKTKKKAERRKTALGELGVAWFKKLKSIGSQTEKEEKKEKKEEEEWETDGTKEHEN